MSPEEKQRPKGLRISQLAKLADVSIPTIKHYLKEGLLPKPVKTGRTMSYYDQECVDIVKLIKRLQTEKYLPLSVIKGIIDQVGANEDDTMLGESLAGVLGQSAVGSAVSRGEIERKTRYPISKIDSLEEGGFIYPRVLGEKKEYDFIDCQIISLVKEREEAGIPFDYSVKMLSIFKRHINGIVREEAGHFLNKLLKEKDIEEVLTNTIRGDRALIQFMPLIRTKLTLENTKRMIDRVNRAPELIREAFDFTLTSQNRGGFFIRKKQHDVESPLLKVIEGALRNEGMDSPKRGDNLPLIFEKDSDKLLRGFAAIVEGEGAKAEAIFNEVNIPSRFSSLKSAFLGICGLLKTSGASGPLQMIDETRDVVKHLSASIGKSGDEKVDLIISYLRGVGLSLIPELSNIHERAEKDLWSLISPDAELKKEFDGMESSPFEELSLKSLYFLALMQTADGRLDEALSTLERLRESGGEGNYGDVAERVLKEVREMIERGE
ncbi:MAG: MerR family transcriptional regulator [Deltaproteobacteria bacterium]|uniref:MerR family transcriptional regulator n=1 Tax=Candidatus Zymogenus saltonus TaxID=2844893 RepID=A0A9D8KF23_9DELT|nr:MerR family transcriptional regulator [Candidatus Zymogenus saltonus]